VTERFGRRVLSAVGFLMIAGLAFDASAAPAVPPACGPAKACDGGLLCAAGACKLDPGPAGQIRALRLERLNAFNARDIDGIMKTYGPAQEVQIFNIVPPRQYTRDSYRADLVMLFRMLSGPFKLELVDLGVTAGTGDLAYSHGIERLTGTRRDGGHTEIVMRITGVYRKIAGKWLIIHEHTSVPIVTESRLADLLSKETFEGGD
jgi:ketosteroid isomerase-like protein